MALRQQILDKLKHLSYPQFEEVLFRLDIEIWNIPGPIAQPTLRAMAVIKRLEQERDGAGFERLEKVLGESAILAIGEQYQGREVETQVKQLLSEYAQKVFAGREAEQDDLNQFVREKSSGVLLVTAPAGFGKSALLANWQKTRHEHYFIAYHCFNSRSDRTRSVSDAYRHLLRQLSIYYNLRNQQLPEYENALRDNLVGILQDFRSREDKPLVIVLDGLDEAEKTFEPFFASPLPAGVFVIASARAEINDEPEYLRNWTEGAERFYLDRLPREAIASWLEKIDELASYSQDSYFVNKLDEITGGFPLYMSFLIEDLKREAKQPTSDVWKVLSGSPGDFTKYVQEQFNRLAQMKEIQQKQEVQELFAVLSVALGALSKDDVKKVTGLNSWKLPSLPWQATRWFSIQQSLYSFAHPLLAQEFQKALESEAETARKKLIDYCAKWQEHQSPYALRYYAEHLRQAKHWPELYELARSEAFAGAQQEKLPDEPDLRLRTVQVALRSAAEIDNAAGMAEFLLVHARRQQQITGQETPLKALRAGNLQRAWTLADQFDMERRALWYLLLAWELAGDKPENTGRIEEAKKALERLQSKNLPRLSKGEVFSPDDWKAGLAVELLAQNILAVKEWNFLSVARQLLDDKSLKELSESLVKRRDLASATFVAQQIDNSRSRAEALKEIALAQVNAGSIDAARSTLEKALGVARQIDDSYYRAEALKEIALAQVNAGSIDAARSTLEEALGVAQQIERESNRARIVEEIATAAVKVGLSRQVLLAAEKILVNRNKHLPNIAAAFVETGDKASFKQLLIPCASSLDAAYQMCVHLARLYHKKQNVEAVAKVVSGENN